MVLVVKEGGGVVVVVVGGRPSPWPGWGGTAALLALPPGVQEKKTAKLWVSSPLAHPSTHRQHTHTHNTHNSHTGYTYTRAAGYHQCRCALWPIPFHPTPLHPEIAKPATPILLLRGTSVPCCRFPSSLAQGHGTGATYAQHLMLVCDRLGWVW